MTLPGSFIYFFWLCSYKAGISHLTLRPIKFAEGMTGFTFRESRLGIAGSRRCKEYCDYGRIGLDSLLVRRPTAAKNFAFAGRLTGKVLPSDKMIIGCCSTMDGGK